MQTLEYEDESEHPWLQLNKYATRRWPKTHLVRADGSTYCPADQQNTNLPVERKTRALVEVTYHACLRKRLHEEPKDVEADRQYMSLLGYK